MNFLSKWSIKTFAHQGAQIVLMEQPLLLTFAEAVCLEYFSKDILTDLIPSAFGILVYNDFTSKETRNELPGTKSIWLTFLRKMVASWRYYGISLTIG